MALRIFLLICVAAMVTSQALAEPPLPVGLGDTAEAKQVTEEPQSEPALPEGLGDLNSSTSPTDSDGLTQPSALPGWRLSGFIDTRIGARTREPIDQESFSLAETRLQLKRLIWLQTLWPKLIAPILVLVKGFSTCAKPICFGGPRPGSTSRQGARF